MSIIKKTNVIPKKAQKTYVLTLASGTTLTLDPSTTEHFPKDSELKGLDLLSIIRDTYNATNPKDRAVLVELKDPAKQSAEDQIEAKKKEIYKLLEECEQIEEDSQVQFAYRGPDYAGYTYYPTPDWMSSTDKCERNDVKRGWVNSSDNC